jgi:hypothetical protein
VVGSPLFIVSGPELVIAQCKAGTVGSFPALNAPGREARRWLTRIENKLGEYKALHPEKKVAPYAVNQICHASNHRLMKDMETCVKHRVPIIITSLRPPREIVEATHFYGGVLFHDVINVKHARTQGCRAGRRWPHSGLRRRRRARRNAGNEAKPDVADHRNGRRPRSLMETVGPIEIAVPRARLIAPEGWKSQARAYRRDVTSVDDPLDFGIGTIFVEDPDGNTGGILQRDRGITGEILG